MRSVSLWQSWGHGFEPPRPRTTAHGRADGPWATPRLCSSRAGQAIGPGRREPEGLALTRRSYRFRRSRSCFCDRCSPRPRRARAAKSDGTTSWLHTSTSTPSRALAPPSPRPRSQAIAPSPAHAARWSRGHSSVGAGRRSSVVEQNAAKALEISDYAYVLELGQNRYEGSGEAIRTDERVRRLYPGAEGQRLSAPFAAPHDEVASDARQTCLSPRRGPPAGTASSQRLTR